jgi:hypothetical protein
MPSQMLAGAQQGQLLEVGASRQTSASAQHLPLQHCVLGGQQ